MSTISAQVCMFNLYTKRLGGFCIYSRFITDLEFRICLVDAVNKYDIITLLSIGDQRIIDELLQLCSNSKVLSKSFENGEIIATFYKKELTVEELIIGDAVDQFIRSKSEMQNNILSLRMMRQNNVHYVHFQYQSSQTDAAVKINNDYVYMTFD